MRYGNYIVIACCAGLGLGVLASSLVNRPKRDITAEVVEVERARVKALLAHDWEAVRKLAHPDFEHEESNGSKRTINGFVEAMQWCGKDGVTPGAPKDMPPGGGFSFKEHAIDWRSVSVFILPSRDGATVTGKYTNILRRCFRGDPDGEGKVMTGVETPNTAKPATFTRYYEIEHGKPLLRWHRALVDSTAPAGSMSKNFPPAKED